MNERVRTAPYQQRPPTPADGPGALGVLGAAFRQENSTVNLFQQRLGQAPLDPDFDITAAAKNSKLWADHGDRLARAQSLAEFQAIETKIGQEKDDREILAQAGVGGFAAAMAAGVMSPAIFIPLVGPSLGVRGAGQAFALAAAAATVDELPLLANQELRTWAEAGVGIAAGTVLGGLLGSTAVYLRTRDFQRLAADLEAQPTVPRAAVVQDAEGRVVRVGDDVEVQMPAGLALRPAEVAQVREIESAASAVLARVKQDDWAGVRALAADEAAPPRVREIAQRAIDNAIGTSKIAEELSLDAAVVRAAQKVVAAQARGPEAVAAETAAFASRAEGMDPALVQQLFARITEEAGAGAPPRASDAVAAVRASLLEPLQTKAPTRFEPPSEGGSVGAARPGERAVPLLPQLNEETGRLEYVPLGDPNKLPDPGTLANDPKGVLTTLAKINPVVRVIQQSNMPVKIQSARLAMMQMSDSGLQYTGAVDGIPPAPGGTIEALMGIYWGRLGDAYRIQYDAYIEYLGKENNFITRRKTDFFSTFNLRPGEGKLTFMEFKEQVVDSFHNRQAPRVPQADKAASLMRERFFGFINNRMLAVTEGRGAKALYKIIDPTETEDGVGYFPQIFSVDEVYNDREGFIQMVQDHYQSAASASASRRWQKLQQRAEAEEGYEELLAMSADAARAELDAIEDALKGMPNVADTSPEYTAVRALREERRQLLDEELDRLLDTPSPSTGQPLYRRGDEDSERAAQKMARQNIRQAYRDLTAEIDAAEAKLPAQVLQTLDEQKRLRSRRSFLQKSAGRLEEKQSDALAKINSNEELNLRTIEAFEKKALALSARLDRIDDTKLDAELAKLEAQFEKALGTIERSETKLAKLRAQAGTEFEPTEKISIEESLLQMRQQRAENALERFGKAADYDRAGARQALQDRLAVARRYAAKTIAKRGERNAVLKQKFADSDPEQVALRIEDMRAGRQAREDDFVNWLVDAGVDDFDLGGGKFDFSTAARHLATTLSYKITGSPLRIAQLDEIAELRGPMKRRVLDIPYEQKRKYLERDSERVLARYTQTMGSDIEMYRAFGSTDGRNLFENVQKEIAKAESYLRTREVDEAGKPVTEKRRKKEVAAFDKGSKEILRDLQHSTIRLRGMAGMPQDPTSFWYRAGRTIMLANVPLMMGSAMLSSIPDLARPVMVHGLTRTFRDGWSPFLGGLVSQGQREINEATRKQLALMNIGIEMFTQQRAQSTFDIAMDTPGRSRFERGVEFLARKTPQVALFGPWTDWNRSVAGMATMARVLEGIDRIAAGRMKQSDSEFTYITSLGITPEYAERIAFQYNKASGHNVIRGVKVPNLESWDDPDAFMAFGAAMNRESERIIIQPGMERMRVADEHLLGRMVMQFRSFTMAAHSKMLISGLQQRDMAAFNFLSGTVMALALGALSYYAWARATSEDATKEMMEAGWDVWMDQAIYRSGVLGAFSEVQSIGGKIPLVSDYVNFQGQELAGRRPSSLMGAVLGPSFGTAETISNVILGLDNPTQGTLGQARKLVPYQNVFYLRRAITMMEEGLGESLGLPERRQ